MATDPNRVKSAEVGSSKNGSSNRNYENCTLTIFNSVQQLGNNKFMLLKHPLVVPWQVITDAYHESQMQSRPDSYFLQLNDAEHDTHFFLSARELAQLSKEKGAYGARIATHGMTQKDYEQVAQKVVEIVKSSRLSREIFADEPWEFNPNNRESTSEPIIYFNGFIPSNSTISHEVFEPLKKAGIYEHISIGHCVIDGYDCCDLSITTVNAFAIARKLKLYPDDATTCYKIEDGPALSGKVANDTGDKKDKGDQKVSSENSATHESSVTSENSMTSQSKANAAHDDILNDALKEMDRMVSESTLLSSSTNSHARQQRDSQVPYSTNNDAALMFDFVTRRLNNAMEGFLDSNSFGFTHAGSTGSNSFESTTNAVSTELNSTELNSTGSTQAPSTQANSGQLRWLPKSQ